MKRYDELTDEQKKLAFTETLRQIITGLVNGTVHIKIENEIHHNFMVRALERGWMDGDFEKFFKFTKISAKFKKEVIEIAEFSARNAFYTEPKEFVLYNIAE
jgi:hypothetical protein